MPVPCWTLACVSDGVGGPFCWGEWGFLREVCPGFLGWLFSPGQPLPAASQPQLRHGHLNPALLVYAVQKKDLLLELWPGPPHSRTRGLGRQGDAAEDPGWDAWEERQGPGQGKLGILSIQCPLVL